MIFGAVLDTGTHLPCMHASRSNYGMYLPLRRMAAAMFAPCLLGCRGTARQRPVPDSSGSRRLPHSPAGISIIRHQKAFSNTLSSGLLIRWRTDAGQPIDITSPAPTWTVYARSIPGIRQVHKGQQRLSGQERIRSRSRSRPRHTFPRSSGQRACCLWACDGMNSSAAPGRLQRSSCPFPGHRVQMDAALVGGSCRCQVGHAGDRWQHSTAPGRPVTGPDDCQPRREQAVR